MYLMLGKRRAGHQKKKNKTHLTSFLMTKHYRAGFLDPNEAGRGSPCPAMLEAAYISLLRGMVRLMDGDLDRSSGRGVAG